MKNTFSNREKIEKLQNSINIINRELNVRKPRPSIRTLFNGKLPKNRLNLKNINTKIIQKNKNEIKKISPKKPPSIQSLIKSSLNNEFLNAVKTNNFKSTKVIPLINPLSNSTLYSLKSNNNINNHNSKNNIINNTLNNNIILKEFNSTGSFPKLVSKPSSQTSQTLNETKSTINPKQEKDLNQLYKEYIQNVSILKLIYFNIIRI